MTSNDWKSTLVASLISSGIVFGLGGIFIWAVQR